MTYRILHIADIHLDMAFTGLEAKLGRRCRERLRESFERALHLGRERGVDAVCIAGDLYEDGRSGPDRAEYLRRVFFELAPMRVFLSPGNHDPCTPSSVYRQIAPLPENVIVFDRRRFTRAALADGLTLWGFGHEHEADHEPAVAGFTCEGPGTHLLLFHGSDRHRVPPGKDAVAPFTAAEIERTGAHYAMVGHFHGLTEGTRYAYPGSLEPHNFSQDGRHTASIVTIEDGRISTEFVDLNRMRYVDLIFDVSPFGDRAALTAALREQLERTVDEPGSVFCRVRLGGEAQSTLDADVGFIEAELADQFPGVALVEEFAAFDYDALQREGRTVRSEFLRAMRARIADALPSERPLLEQALRYGMLAFARRTIPI